MTKAKVMFKCKQCGKEYSIEEVERCYGDVWWKGQVCSARCYTIHFCDTGDVVEEA